MKIERKIKNINCSTCAGKIEKEIKKIPKVKYVTLNLISEKITLEIENKRDVESILEKAQSIVDKIEPGGRIILEKEEQISKNYNIWKISISLMFLISSFLLKDNLRIVFLIISYLTVGTEVIKNSLKSISKGDVFNENFLMTIATIGAIAIGEYPEAVAIMLFYQIGEEFQDRALEKSRRSIRELVENKIEFANLRQNEKIVRKNPEDIEIGDIIVVKPGEKVPLDGKIVKGDSFFNTSAITGEYTPKKVSLGEKVLSGYINENQLIEVEVENKFENSTISKIMELVEESNAKKTKTERFITIFAKYYTPIVVFIAAIVAFIVPVIVGEELREWVYKALVFLTISCPCALVISIPLSFFGGIGASSKNGILIKGGNYLELGGKVKSIVMDKTGTLTEGVFLVKDIVVSSEYNIKEEELLKIVATAELGSNHPIGTSILKKWGKDIDNTSLKEYTEIPGKGIIAKIDSDVVFIGNKKLMIDNDITVDELDSGTAIFVAINKKYAGYISIGDKIKENSLNTIIKLRTLGIENIVVLTGDNLNGTKKVMEELNITEYYTELSPKDKVIKLEDTMKKYGEVTMFIGDGINDTPVLARADIGVSMGKFGTDSAVETSDIVIMNDDIAKIVDFIKISRNTKKIVIQNIILALGVKIIAMLLGLLGFATIWMAVFADVGVSIIAIINSIRTLKYKSTI